MPTGSTLVNVRSPRASVTGLLFRKAERRFKRKFKPTESVQIIRINYLGVAYRDGRFEHTFSIHWEEP